jgi:hypothetical protein
MPVDSGIPLYQQLQSVGSRGISTSHERDSLLAHLASWSRIFIEVACLAGLATTNRSHERYIFDRDSSPFICVFPKTFAGKIPLLEQHKLSSPQLMSSGELRSCVLIYQTNPHQLCNHL